jgi:hypothetical protein
MTKYCDYWSRNWVKRDGEKKDVCYDEICYLCCHFAKKYVKTLSRIVIKYVREVFLQTMLKGMMNEDVHSVDVPIIQFTRFTSFICWRILFKVLFLL